jgi:hypothetical protein
MRTKRAGANEWESYFSSLSETEGYAKEPEGYLTALAICYRAYKRELSLPDVIFPWEEPTERRVLIPASAPNSPASP